MNSNSKIALICSVLGEGRCGVEDYTLKLYKNYFSLENNMEIIFVNNLGDFLKVLKNINITMIHVQYPMLAWRKSFTPIISLVFNKLFFYKKIILTIHEYSQAHKLRKYIILFLAFLSDHIVYTSIYEKNQMPKVLNKKSVIIPIGTGISNTYPRCDNRKLFDVTYFGLLMPNKGLEDFINIVKNLNTNNLNFAVIGNVVAGHEMWLDGIRKQYQFISFYTESSEEKVSQLLQASTLMLLPYPDGISERRGTFLASLNHSLQVVTTDGGFVTDELKETVHLYSNQCEAVDIIQKLLLSKNFWISNGVFEKYLAQRSWFSIAKKHSEVYRSLH
ncbi:hypothetical protein [Polynucleobacter sp. es-EL-1]|uniref:hypothetical protein n=1 Tax=Polynucleobacter sp. es-EL-1 TaxID=1855652 RepID=UPI001BFE0356|nr:hypothetical protein [Polynucleobacter sp. es-EL-1]QWE10887.1 hypothetical protein FD974_01715 [Polynucleobacter sp. es-EL-1]